MELNKYIEHTNLNNKATLKDIEKLCNEAIKYDFAAVVVYPYYVRLAKELLKDTNVEIDTVVGFPLGANTIETKVYEAIDCIEKGATEIDLNLVPSGIGIVFNITNSSIAELFILSIAGPDVVLNPAPISLAIIFERVVLPSPGGP